MSSLKDRDAVARIVMAHREHVIALGEPPAQRGVSAAWRLSFISRRSCISRTGGSSATSAREQEARPGVDQRDEVLHRMELAQTREEAHAAAHSFLRWLEELEILE
jgi:hypothetical protein